MIHLKSPSITDSASIGRLFTCVLILASVSSAWAGLRWENAEQNAELNPDQNSIHTEFTFTNEGPRPVTITSAQASCGCTKPVFPSEAIAPGASGKLSVSYTRNGAQQQNTRIAVTTDEADREPYVLTWHVAAPDWLEITPRLLLWKASEDAQTKSFRVKLHPDSKATFLDVTGADASLVVNVRRPVPGTDEPMVVDVRPTTTASTQPLRSTLRLRFRRGEETVTRVVYVRVQ